ncbi:MAG: FtsH protease activity modulator HflK [Micavibrio sp.]|nr:FtsH protease activity modulator HflK [Micavibrio sp.]
MPHTPPYDRADDRAADGLIILENQGPWGNRGGDGGGNNGGNNNGGGNNPWGERPRGGGNQPPDLDDMLRNAQDKFKNRFGGGNMGGRGAGSMETGRALAILAVVVVLFWAATGFYQVAPQEDAVILRFGQVTGTNVNPGLDWHIPWPVEEAITVPVSRTNQLNIGFNASGGGDNPSESAMLTGDENIVNIHFSVFWNIGDAKKYLFEIQAPVEGTVQKVAESAMREIIGHTEILKALTEGRADIEVKTKELMQKMLDDYNSGVVVNSVQLLSVDPPQPVVDAFNDVQRARTEKERAKNEADAYANDIVPRAKGAAKKITIDAEAYKAATVAKAQGDAARFDSVYTAYAQSKDVTHNRMYLDTMQDVMKNSRKIIVGSDKGLPVLPYLPLDGKGRVTTPPAPQN